MNQILHSNSTHVRRWSEQEFESSAAEWQTLLSQSGADPLFMSWDWQWRWWQCHKEMLGAQLMLFAAYRPDGSLAALAPCYTHSVEHKGGLSGTRLELIGGAWRITRGVLSEYLDVIVARDAVETLQSDLAEALGSEPWDDLVFENIQPNSVAEKLAREHFGARAYIRTADPLEAHATPITGSFEDYLQRLNSGARRRIWNHRKRLAQPTLKFAAAGEVSAFLDGLDALHASRWGKAHYVGIRRAFHTQFAAAMAERGALRMSSLASGGETFSLAYNIRAGNTEYNLQSGFDVAKAAGVSPGYLHLGYCIEQAYADHLERFDFLAGEGRNRQYKSDFRTQASALSTMQVIRGSKLRLFYQTYDKLSGWRAKLVRKSDQSDALERIESPPNE